MWKFESIAICILFISLTSSTDWRFFIDKFHNKFGKCPPFFKKYCTERFLGNQQNSQVLEINNENLIDILPVPEIGVWTPYFNETIPDHAFLTELHKSYLVKIDEEAKSVFAFHNDSSQTTTFLNGSSYEGRYEFIFTFTDLKRFDDFSTELFGNYLTFRVKGKHEVTVKFLSALQCYEISIGVITNHFIGVNECLKEFASTAYVEKGLLDSKESRGFWVYWSDSAILMGLEGDVKPKIKVETSITQQFYKVEYSCRSKVEWKAPSFLNIVAD